MIHSGGEPLFRSLVEWRGKSAANIAGLDPHLRRAQLGQGPGDILQREPPTLPVRDGILGTQTIEIDCDIHVGSSQFGSEPREMFPPIRPQDRTAATLIRRRAIVGPRMNFESPFALGAPVAKKLARPPAFEIPAAPDAD